MSSSRDSVPAAGKGVPTLKQVSSQSLRMSATSNSPKPSSNVGGDSAGGDSAYLAYSQLESLIRDGEFGGVQDLHADETNEQFHSGDSGVVQQVEKVTSAEQSFPRSKEDVATHGNSVPAVVRSSIQTSDTDGSDFSVASLRFIYLLFCFFRFCILFIFIIFFFSFIFY